MALDLITKRIAISIYRRRAAEYQEWEEGARAARAEGFRPDRCPHGTNWHVDYDPICPFCEDPHDGTTPYAIHRNDTRSWALNLAKTRVAVARRMRDDAGFMHNAGVIDFDTMLSIHTSIVERYLTP